ncbi:hypothetical protein [Paenibacillus sp. UNC496MF]|uniref:hypothetical protein n=1 Tax=Paenibacillus sp. UNC496MF TaxID=1502753 RepID=UPI000B81AA21|nr:hypothetical protein [Paenibacillus sp. UNC496MF]
MAEASGGEHEIYKKALQVIIENSVNGAPLPNVNGTIFMRSDWEAGTLRLDDDREISVKKLQ